MKGIATAAAVVAFGAIAVPWVAAYSQTGANSVTLLSGAIVCGTRKGIEALKANMSVEQMGDLGCYRIVRDIRSDNPRTFANRTLVYSESLTKDGKQRAVTRWVRATSVSGLTSSTPVGDDSSPWPPPEPARPEDVQKMKDTCKTWRANGMPITGEADGTIEERRAKVNAICSRYL
jgi:hypothetical protein